MLLIVQLTDIMGYKTFTIMHRWQIIRAKIDTTYVGVFGNGLTF
jgi:hypothetical protein